MGVGLADDQSALFSTRRACLEDGLMAQEQAFLTALESATTYALGLDQLIIVYGDGQQLVFIPSIAEMQ